ncbi:MAG: hypothetical protein HVN35_00675 [Methanobacteriaceae archaeon]|nr:hypothetical protein [Methanobacteriaceae archaeon]
MLMNPRLEYAAYSLKELAGSECDKTRFYQLMCLLDREEGNFGCGLDVPYYWYLDGVMINDSEHLFHLRKRDLFDIIPQDEKKTIDKAIICVLEKYESKSSKELQSEIFKDAPFPFQKEFSKFLMVVRGWKEKTTLDNYFNCGYADILNLLEKLERSFPQKEFEDLYPLFLKWKKSTECMVKKGKSRVKTGLLAEKFSYLLSKKLKVVAHENIYPEIVASWRSDYEKARVNFEEFLLDFQPKAQSNHEPSIKD